jgi:hypothetical protein
MRLFFPLQSATMPDRKAASHGQAFLAAGRMTSIC